MKTLFELFTCIFHVIVLVTAKGLTTSSSLLLSHVVLKSSTSGICVQKFKSALGNCIPTHKYPNTRRTLDFCVHPLNVSS